MKNTILRAALLAGVVMSAGAAQAQGHRDRPDFATLDANGDGVVTMAELQAQGDARFAARDTNGDGALSAAELQAAGAEHAAERAARMLERLDANGDGLLQQSELQARGGDRMAQMFDRADANDDGAISEAEFAAAKERRREGGRRHGEGRGPRGGN